MEAERYSLVRTIASGGMGQVYEAIVHGHGGFSRRVAIKRLLPELLGDPGAKELFRDEARIASYLHHGNIVQVIDYGVVDGAEFLVLEYVDGLDAYRLVRTHGKLPVPLALYIVGEVAEALTYAHARTDDDGKPLGIVHRDVSAQNVLVSWEGDVKLSDFGIALAATRDTHTKTGMVKGKVGYMAPEQLLGRRATSAVDVYSLGITLQVLVTGVGPGEVTDAQMMSLPDDVRALIAACTHDAPQDRCTAGEVATQAHLGCEGTGRSALRSYMAHVRGRTSTPRSALDDLMGLVLVASGPGQFTISKVVEISPPSPPTTPDATTHGIAVRVAAPTRGAPRSRRWLAVLLVLLVLAVAVVVVQLQLFATNPGTPRDTPAGTSLASVSPAPSSVDSRLPEIESADANLADASVAITVMEDARANAAVVEEASVESQGAGRIPSKRRTSTKTKRDGSAKQPDANVTPPRGSDAVVVPPPPPAPTATGCLRISGAGNWNNANVRIDPDPRPPARKSEAAPINLDVVPVGTYRVRITEASEPPTPGKVIADRTVDVPAGRCVNVAP